MNGFSKFIHPFYKILCCLAVISGIAFLTGCAGNPKQTAVCPFSDLTWEASPEDAIESEGDAYQTYDSIYNGSTYTFPKRYLKQDGTIKYMFDDKDALMCFAWTVQSDDEASLQALYDEIHAQLVKTYGESGYNTSKSTNYGDVWHLKQGDIVLSVMKTASQKALQYSYMHPAVSYKAEN